MRSWLTIRQARLPDVRQASDQHVDAEMAVLAQGDDGAEEGEPDEEPARDLLRDTVMPELKP